VLPELPRELVLIAAHDALEFWRGYDGAQAIARRADPESPAPTDSEVAAVIAQFDW